MWHDSVCNTVQEPTVTSTIVAKKTTTWGESGFPSEFLGSVLVHWWDNTTRNLYVAFYPHAVSYLPINNPTYFFRKIGEYGAFEYNSTGWADCGSVGSLRRRTRTD